MYCRPKILNIKFLTAAFSYQFVSQPEEILWEDETGRRIKFTKQKNTVHLLFTPQWRRSSRATTLKEYKAAYVQQIINFSAPFPWFLTIAGALEYEIPVVFSPLLRQFTVRHKTISIYKWTVKKSASVYDLLVHQYGGVVTVAKFLSRDWKPSISSWY